MQHEPSSDLRDPAAWDINPPTHSTRHLAPFLAERLASKRILLTGAAGSIGSALATAISSASPASLILFDTSEAALYQVDRQLQSGGSQQHIPLIGSACDPMTLSHLFKRYRPQIVFHAAAFKHVPLMERNPFAAISNNALGTLTLIEAAIAYQADQLILVSTDKAVDPHSIMGASKRIAELILLTPDARSEHTTRLAAVRLCNVIGSQGSVLPLFLDQIARNHPLTVTHPEATRFFIPLGRAVDSIFSALQAPSSPALLFPDPGEPVRILDLAHHLLRTHASSAAIEFTGLRPGDKLSELLVSARERVSPHPIDPTSILRSVETPTPTLGTLQATLSELRDATHTHNLPRLLRAIHNLVPEYTPSTLITSELTEAADKPPTNPPPETRA